MKRNYVLGIHDGHNCGATLLADGEVVASICEERLTRRKNEVGYPTRSIEYVLRSQGVAPEELLAIGIASNFMHDRAHLEDISIWYRVGLADQKRDKAAGKDYNRTIFESRRRERIEVLRQHLGVESEAIEFVEHHLAHAATAYHGCSWSVEEPILVLTCDGAGDGLCATVNVGRDGHLERVAQVHRAASLGKIYSRVTYLLGMKPWEHEFKVMGLAPYAGERERQLAREVFEELLELDEEQLQFRNRTELETNYCYFHLRDRLENIRFDGIAGGLQDFTEDLLARWAAAGIRRTGIHRIACAGGVFMNVKANLRIAELEELEGLYVFPSCGDESLSIGAAYHVFWERQRPSFKIPFSDIYLGAGYEDRDVERAIAEADLPGGLRVQRIEDIDREVGRLLAEDEIVARFAGRMEWGARALGNRSILAHPSSLQNVKKINAMIKQRDFWMPFAPSLLASRADEYIRNPRRIPSPHMMLAFESGPAAARDMAAALHAYDGTLRAQIVEERTNPRYHRVLESFAERTGIGGVLNTSFNLHGYPIVCSPQDALDVFARSGLQHLALESFLVSKVDA